MLTSPAKSPLAPSPPPSSKTFQIISLVLLQKCRLVSTISENFQLVSLISHSEISAHLTNRMETVTMRLCNFRCLQLLAKY